MIQRVKIGNIQLPRLYICETNEDVQLARSNGLPYVRWKEGMDSFVKALLRPAIERLFPGINWNAVLGKRKPIRSRVVITESVHDESDPGMADYDKDEMLANQYQYDEIEHDYSDAEPDDGEEFTRVVDIADGERSCQQDRSFFGYDSFDEDRLSVYDYVGDVDSQVDIEVLQKLKMLPDFVGKISDIIRKNLSANQYWTEGYNKKLGQPLGNFKNRSVLPNLMIIDISASIPDGIAATMLMLADTLRTECNAELIITSRRSGYYPLGAELPKVQTLRDYYGRSNESAEFMAILDQYIAGREWGHVISFGDDDYPGMLMYCHEDKPDMTGTVVHQVHHYHTRHRYTRTGYARWVHEVCPEADEEFDTSWCKIMKEHYKF